MENIDLKTDSKKNIFNSKILLNLVSPLDAEDNREDYRKHFYESEKIIINKKQIPKKLFNKALVLDKHFQFHILDEELKIFFEKLKSLKSKLISVIFTQKNYSDLFETFSEDNKRNFNSKLKETLILSKEIHAAILSKFEQDLKSAGITSFPVLMHSQPTRSECEVLTVSCEHLRIVIEAFKGAIAAYRTLAKKKDSKQLGHSELEILFMLLSKARLNISELLDELIFTEKFINEKFRMSESTLNLHSVAQILNVPEEVIEKLKKSNLNDYNEIKALTPKESNEIIEEIFNTRKYLNTLSSSAPQSKSTVFSRLISNYNKSKGKGVFPYWSEGILRADRSEKCLTALNDPKLYRNISNLYGPNPSEKLLSSEKFPLPTRKVRYFPDIGLKKAMRLAKIITKSSNY